MILSLLLTSAAQAADFSWALVGQIPNAFDIAVCPDGTLIGLTTSSAGQPLIRSNTSVLTGSLGSTTNFLTWGGGVDHISCGTSGGATALQFLSGDYIGTMLYPTTYGYTYGVYTYAPDADDVKAMGVDEIIVHNTDRYDYRGVRTSSGTFTFTYLGDMWGARDIAATQYATSDSGEVAFALNDGWAADYSIYANFPQWSGNLDFDVSWVEAQRTVFSSWMAQLGTDAEAVRTTSGTYLFVLTSGGYVYRGTYLP